MNKKWILGLGLGVGGLLLVGGGLVATGYWADRQMDGGVAILMKSQERAQKIAELNARYPFQPPATGKVLKLEEARLEAYLAAREATLPAYDVLQKETLAFVQEHGSVLSRGSRSAQLRVAGASMRMMGKAQTALLLNLEAQGMSPQEFGRLTAVVYPEPVAAPDAGVPMVSQASDPANLALLEEQLAAIAPRLEDPKLGEAERLQLEQRRAGLRKYITQLELASGKDVTEANAALLKKHAARIAKAANPTFDQLLTKPLTTAGTAGLPTP
ncbi:hypothetical protein COCOR_00505 [Corallococcus coralloides DSM 2259]|uniref:Uncharacterized protein n=1 Tax=Corallococcus coralloides (strain ATCC 25202 / DSM 2259 / NBRC 100086 / M2) TaxID=1144275 RepID=H8N1B2_CORCM|nr:hypothetical protein [Corallococcus coralloides]AFE03530.1 hypothetical protein COCOR_00505 [Corallococcus coralloides DSM 2259]